jgi:hypothetical protein
MATTAKSIVPAPKDKGQKARKPMTKQHKAKLVAALANWRASLTDEDRAAFVSIIRWRPSQPKPSARDAIAPLSYRGWRRDGWDRWKRGRV